MYVCIHVNTYVCVYIYINIYIYIYIWGDAKSTGGNVIGTHLASHSPETPKWLTSVPVESSSNQFSCSELLLGSGLGAEVSISDTHLLMSGHHSGWLGLVSWAGRG